MTAAARERAGTRRISDEKPNLCTIAFTMVFTPPALSSAASACAVLFLGALLVAPDSAAAGAVEPAVPWHANTSGHPAEQQVQARSVTLHIVRAEAARTGQRDSSDRSDFERAVTAINNYLRNSGVAITIKLGHVSNWTGAYGDSCGPWTGSRYSRKNGWHGRESLKVLTYQPGCSGDTTSGSAEIGGQYLFVGAGATYDVLAHELIHTFGPGHSSVSSCVTSLTRKFSKCPWPPDSGGSVRLAGMYGDVSDVMGGYDRGALVGQSDSLTANEVTGLLNPAHLASMRHLPGSAVNVIDVDKVVEPVRVSIPVRETLQDGRFVRLDSRKITGLYISVSSGAGKDRPYRTRSGPGRETPEPADREPALLLHSVAASPGGSVLLNAVGGVPLGQYGPGVYGSGIVSGVAYPLGNGATLTLEEITPTGAVVVVSPETRSSRANVQADATREGSKVTVELSWPAWLKVKRVTALWRDGQQVVRTADFGVSGKSNRATIGGLPSLKGWGGWRFALETATSSTLTDPVYLSRG